MLRNRIFRLASSLLLLGGFSPPLPAASLVEYRDNPRPIELHLPREAGLLRHIQVVPARPRGAVLNLEVGPQGPPTLRALPRNATLRAKAEGRALPMTAYVGLGIGRFGRTRDGRLGLYWGLEDHVGVAYWPPGTRDRGPLFQAATRLEKVWNDPSPTAWFAYAAELPAGATLRFQFHGVKGLLFLHGGSPEVARVQLDRQLDEMISMGRDWKPLRGTHSPAFLGSAESPHPALLIAGPLLLTAGGPSPEATLRRMASWIHRPLPGTPSPRANPMADGEAPGKAP